MELAHIRQWLHVMRKGPMIIGLLLFGALLLGLHVLRSDLPARLTRQMTGGPSVVEQVRARTAALTSGPGGGAQQSAIAVQVPRPSYDAAALRDPLVGPWHRQQWTAADWRAAHPPSEPEAPFEPPVLRIEGIIWGGPKPFAIVNGSIVRPGDVFEGAEIVRIERNRVVVAFQGRELAYAAGSPDQPQPEVLRSWQQPPVGRQPF